MKNYLFLILLSLSAYGSVEKTLNETVDFFDWLVKHQRDFANCSPKKNGSNFELCDNTLVSVEVLKGLFKIEAKEALIKMEKLNLKTEVLCDPKSNEKNNVWGVCKTETSNKMFNEITSLHGKYVPENKTIYMKSSASKGSLIHEYIHSLQSENTRPIHGKIYKKERNRLHAELTAIMDDKIKIIKELEAKKDKTSTAPHMKEFLLASQLMKYFADWQDLIDERSIFLLYLNFGKELGVVGEDLELAKINMKYICKNEKLKKILPANQCVF